jgi:hypothetical protein
MQVGIVIGKGGTALKKLGEAARKVGAEHQQLKHWLMPSLFPHLRCYDKCCNYP